MLISQEPSVRFTSNLDSVWVRVCSTTRWHCFCAMTLPGVYGCTKCIPEGFLAEKQGKIQPGVFPLCFLDVQSCITVIQYFPSSVKKQIHYCSQKTRVP